MRRPSAPPQRTPPSSPRRRGGVPAALSALALACAPAEPSALDSGLLAPIAKDSGVDGIDGGSSTDDASASDADGLDAAAPDAAPLVDRDGDGLPDARDPQPDVANRVLFADDFSTVDPSWLLTSSGMAQSQGAMRASLTDGVVREAWLGPQPRWTDVAVDAEIEISRTGRSREPGAGRAAVMVRILKVVPDQYLACGVDARAGTAFISEHDGGNSAGRVLEETMLPGALGARHDLTISVRGNRYTCRVGGVELVTDSALYSSGSVGIRAHDVVFAVDRVTVYAL